MRAGTCHPLFYALRFIAAAWIISAFVRVRVVPYQLAYCSQSATNKRWERSFLYGTVL